MGLNQNQIIKVRKQKQNHINWKSLFLEWKIMPIMKSTHTEVMHHHITALINLWSLKNTCAKKQGMCMGRQKPPNSQRKYSYTFTFFLYV